MIEIENYIYTEPTLVIYKIVSERKDETHFKIEKRFNNSVRLGDDIQKFINIKRQFMRTQTFSDSFTSAISLKISPNILGGNNIQNTDELNTFISNFVEMNESSNFTQIKSVYSICIISELNDEIYGIFPPVLTNEGIEFFIFNSSDEYKWYLGIFQVEETSDEKLIAKSKELNIKHLLQYYRELELSL